jgi:hypothetical protein
MSPTAVVVIAPGVSLEAVPEIAIREGGMTQGGTQCGAVLARCTVEVSGKPSTAAPKEMLGHTTTSEMRPSCLHGEETFRR